MPNGLIRGRDGLIYVPSTLDGKIDIFSLKDDHMLEKVKSIQVPLPIDNLSFDKNGDIYAACIPQVYKWAESSTRPFDIHPPSTVYRVRREANSNDGIEKIGNSEAHEGDYSIDLIMEDDGSVLPGSTIAVHDAETGRYFLGGAMSAYITICETR